MESIQQNPSYSFGSMSFSFTDVFTASGYGVYLLLVSLIKTIKDAASGSEVKTIPTVSPSLGNYVRLQEETDASDEAELTPSPTSRKSYIVQDDEISSGKEKHAAFSGREMIPSSSPVRKGLLKKAKHQYQPSIIWLPGSRVPFLKSQEVDSSPAKERAQQTETKLARLPEAMQSVESAQTPQQFRRAQITLQGLLYLLNKVYIQVSDRLFINSNAAMVGAKSMEVLAENGAVKLSKENKKWIEAVHEQHDDLINRRNGLEAQIREALVVSKAQFVETGAVLKKLLNNQINLVEEQTRYFLAAKQNGRDDFSLEQATLLKEVKTLADLVQRSKKLAQDCLDKMDKKNRLESEHDIYSSLADIFGQISKCMSRANNLLPKTLQIQVSLVLEESKPEEVIVQKKAMAPRKVKPSPKIVTPPKTTVFMKAVETRVNNPLQLRMDESIKIRPWAQLKAHLGVSAA